MKRYLLFAGDTYYPSGGWSDFVGDFAELQEALLWQLENRSDWFEVVDTQSMKIVGGAGS